MDGFDAGRLMRVNRERLIEIRDRALQLRAAAADVRIKQLAIEIMEAADPVIGEAYQVMVADEARWQADFARTLKTTEKAKLGTLRVGRALQGTLERERFSETDGELAARLGEVHRDLEACLLSIEGDLKRRLAPAEAL